VAVGTGVADDLAHRRHVVGLQAAAERIGEQLLGHRGDELFTPRVEQCPQAVQALEGRTVGQRARRVNRGARVGVAPLAAEHR